MRKDIRLGMLPDPFVCRDGRRVQSLEEWEARREEILEDVIGLEFDGMPPAPEVFRVEPMDLHGRGMTCSYRVHCGTKKQPFTFCFMAYIPKKAGRMPVVLSGDAVYPDCCDDRVIHEANRRGFVLIRFNRTEFAPDFADPDRVCGINALWPERKFSAISAWAWGYSRVVDAIQDLDYIDPERIAVTGHSRGGKTVLLAAATDKRIRYCSPNGSGTHGCAPYRYRQIEDEGEYAGKYSEPLSVMMERLNYWMGQGLWDYVDREETLPYDTHFIKALIAPRCYLETNGYGDIWANPRGSYLCLQAAKEVWKLYGAEDRCACFYRDGGHDHGWAEFNALFDFMEADINGTPLPQSITREPFEPMEPLHDWTAPAAK